MKIIGVGIIFGIVLSVIGVWLIEADLIISWLSRIRHRIYTFIKQDLPKIYRWVASAPKYHTNMAMVILTILLFIPIYLFPFDRIDVNNGLGWDGFVYARYSTDFYENIRNNTPNIFGRVFPSALIYHILKILMIPPSEGLIIFIFSLVNILCVGGIAYQWGIIADEIVISWKGKWLGLLGFLGNYAILKYFAFYPVLTDLISYFLALTLLVCYFRRNTYLQYILLFVGAFTHPTLLYISGLLLVFPKEKDISEASQNDNVSTFFAKGFSLISAGIILFFIFHYYSLITNQTSRWAYESLSPYINISLLQNILLPLGIAIVLLHIYFGLYSLIEGSNLFSIKYYFSPRFIVRLLWIGFTIWTVLYFQKNFPEIPSLGVEAFLPQVFSLALVHPGVFYVAHVLWFGPFVLLIYFLWAPITKIIREHGRGLFFCVALGVFFALVSASRRITVFYPFILPFAIKVIDQMDWSKGKIWTIAIISLIYSRVWLVIGGVGTEWGLYKYAMNQGNYMSFFVYLFFTLVVGLTAIFIYEIILDHNLFPWSLSVNGIIRIIPGNIEVITKRNRYIKYLGIVLLLVILYAFIYYENIFFETTVRQWMGK